MNNGGTILNSQAIEKLKDPSLWSSSGAVVPVPGSAAPSALLLLRLLVRVHVDPPSRDGGRFTLVVHSVSRLT